ncbi:NAD(P)H-hydrate dehydratase [Arthrobacter sp. TMN-49]
MLHAYSAAAVRAAEQPLLAAGRGPELMRTAAHGLAMGVVSVLRSRGRGVYGATVVLLIGSGNNGGDALYAGAYLAAHGARTTALLTSTLTHPEALLAFEKAHGRCVALGEGGAPAGLLREARRCDVVIDGLLGTGGRGGLREPVAGVVTHLAKLSGPGRPAVVACDLPSGVNATTGEVQGPVLRADLTVTFGAHKVGLLSAPGEQLCGSVSLVDLGLGHHLGAPETFRLDAGDMAALLPQPSAADHKYTRGVAGVIAGSAQYPGAGLLAVAAVSACGPGMVRYLGPDQVAAAIHVRNPEVVCSRNSPAEVRVQAWLAGPGIDGDRAQMDRAAAAMASGVPTVVDAAALSLVHPANSESTVGQGSLILTPHAGELSELLSRCGVSLSRAHVEASPLAAARQAAALLGAVVLLKGPTTIVAAPDGRVFTQANGTPRLAAAGSGDTLAGILVALVAMSSESADLATTAALAAALHGQLAQTDVEQPLNAGMLAARIPRVWAELSQATL